MSFESYTALKQEIIDWSHRDDLDLKIPVFIQLAETEMLGNKLESLRVRSQENRYTDTIDFISPSRFMTLPPRYESPRKMTMETPEGLRADLEFVVPSALRVRDGIGVPCFFTVTDQIEFDIEPPDDYDFSFQYISGFVPLSDDNATNDVLDDAPTIYLFGALWALFRHAEEEQKSAEYYQMFISAIQGANRRADNGRYGPAMAFTVGGTTP